MPTEIHVHLLPDHFAPDQLQGGTAVIVDILRASTTILSALNNGASSVRPCLSVEDATTQKDNDPTVLLGGERGGQKIDGFDLSNSPADYDRLTVEGRTIAFTTTNGTRALLHSIEADQILIGAFVNVDRLATALQAQSRPLHIVCAGTNGEVTGEDALFAGCLIDRLLDMTTASVEITDTARMALGSWRHETASRPLAAVLKETRGGKNLVALSYDRDIALAAEQNSQPILARYDQAADLITTPVEVHDG